MNHQVAFVAKLASCVALVVICASCTPDNLERSRHQTSDSKTEMDPFVSLSFAGNTRLEISGESATLNFRITNPLGERIVVSPSLLFIYDGDSSKIVATVSAPCVEVPMSAGDRRGGAWDDIVVFDPHYRFQFFELAKYGSLDVECWVPTDLIPIKTLDQVRVVWPISVAFWRSKNSFLMRLKVVPMRRVHIVLRDLQAPDRGSSMIDPRVLNVGFSNWESSYSFSESEFMEFHDSADGRLYDSASSKSGHLVVRK